ncbi:nif11-like leader peptide domain protein [Synechococcus sp. BIOS-U3-1]|uniref:Nif11-like leader peptide family natural product precursor n=1 Tax=Synechococcus sp. BIOS-U3-1 TaxID=1400865 RepID=UPI00164924FA|nr:Nif11-like leader peptide family natural product precursor [Synechococcus sp. BIOS-U3-1]QNI57824.1 nif11-like leader peptide domain protein [Synechococcus sp. BIOS-U3-1]
MSLEQLKAFLAKVKKDSNLQEKLKAAKSPDEVVSIAKEHGHEFTADKLSQLNEEELEGVAGGGRCCAARYSGCAGGTMAGTL